MTGTIERRVARLEQQAGTGEDLAHATRCIRAWFEVRWRREAASPEARALCEVTPLAEMQRHFMTLTRAAQQGRDVVTFDDVLDYIRTAG